MNRKLTPEELTQRVVVIDVDEIELLEGNPNQADMDALGRSMDEFGQTAAILIADGRVVDGNHRVIEERRTRRFGGRLAAIDISGLDWTAARAAAAGVTLNLTARLGQDDPDALERFLRQAAADDRALLRAMSFNDDLTPIEPEPDLPPPPAAGDFQPGAEQPRLDVSEHAGTWNRSTPASQPATAPQEAPAAPPAATTTCPQCGHEW